MFKKWDIVYISKFPESVQCSNNNCNRFFNLSDLGCPYCSTRNSISSIIAKVRPIILWIDQGNWKDSMAFGVPLSTTKIYSDKYNQKILLSDYVFAHKDNKYEKPMRAVIHQSTRIDGNVLSKYRLIGSINNTIVQQQIENKLLDWIFSG